RERTESLKPSLAPCTSPLRCDPDTRLRACAWQSWIQCVARYVPATRRNRGDACSPHADGLREGRRAQHAASGEISVLGDDGQIVLFRLLITRSLTTGHSFSNTVSSVASCSRITEIQVSITPTVTQRKTESERH